MLRKSPLLLASLLLLALSPAFAQDEEPATPAPPPAEEKPAPVPPAEAGTIATPAEYAEAVGTEIVSQERGVVKWYSDAKGYGFIIRSSNDREIFVHHTDIAPSGFRSLSEGDEVHFDVVKTSKGIVAKNVTRL